MSWKRIEARPGRVKADPLPTAPPPENFCATRWCRNRPANRVDARESRPGGAFTQRRGALSPHRRGPSGRAAPGKILARALRTEQRQPPGVGRSSSTRHARALSNASRPPDMRTLLRAPGRSLSHRSMTPRPNAPRRRPSPQRRHGVAAVWSGLSMAHRSGAPWAQLGDLAATGRDLRRSQVAEGSIAHLGLEPLVRGAASEVTRRG